MRNRGTLLAPDFAIPQSGLRLPCPKVAAAAIDSRRLNVLILVVLVYFALSIWPVFPILRSSETAGEKALWIFLVVCVPIIGPFAWYLVGPKG